MPAAAIATNPFIETNFNACPMTTTLEPAQASLSLSDSESFNAHLEKSATGRHWQSLKQENWERFLALPMPRHREEAWRFASRIDFSPADFHLAEGVDEATAMEICSNSQLIEKETARLTFANNQLLEQHVLPDELAARGVVFTSLAEAVGQHPEILEQFLFQTHTNLGSEVFHALHNAYFENGYLLYVPDNVEIADPFVIYQWLAGDKVAIFPHTLIVAGKNSKFTVLDVQQSVNSEEAGFACAVGNIFADDGAQVFRQTVQNLNERSVSLQLDTNNAQRDTTVRGINLNLGGRRARFENEVRIAGAGATVRLYSLTVAHGKQEFDQRTLQIHDAPAATSDLLYKNALLDESKTIFSGLIKVAPNAQQTDAYQTNRNLLLDPRAAAHSLPGLEIEANDVKCSHGATSGQLDSDELFYFLQRGIPRRVAQELMVFGFFEEVIEQFDNEELEEALRSLIRRKFDQSPPL